jgi:hypothetical protein
MTEIIERLYLGSSLEARDKDWLDSKQITHVLNLAKELPEYFPGEYVYKKLPMEDNESYKMCKHFDDILDFLDLAVRQGTVLVHCMMGISRSATAVILYLMARKGLTCAAARRFVKTKRSFVSPNKGFITQLVNYEMLNLKKEKRALPLTQRHATMVLTGRQVSPKKLPQPMNKKAVREELAEFIKTYIRASSNIDSPICKPIVRSSANFFKVTQPSQDSSVDSFKDEAREILKMDTCSGPLSPQKSLAQSSLKQGSPLHLSALYKHLSITSILKERQQIQSPQNKIKKQPLALRKSCSHHDQALPAEKREKGDSPDAKLTNKEKSEFFKSRNTTDSVPKINRKKKMSSFKSLLIDPLWHAKAVFNKEGFVDKKRTLTNTSKPPVPCHSPGRKPYSQLLGSPSTKEARKVDFPRKLGSCKVGVSAQEACAYVYTAHPSNEKTSPPKNGLKEVSPSTLIKLKRAGGDSKQFKQSGSLQEIPEDP